MGLLFLFFLALIAMFIMLIPKGPPYPYGRVPEKQWTEYDKEGHPVCGVGYRGYWTNTATYGDWPYIDCHCGLPDCSSHKDIKTGEHVVFRPFSEVYEEMFSEARKNKGDE